MRIHNSVLFLHFYFRRQFTVHFFVLRTEHMIEWKINVKIKYIWSKQVKQFGFEDFFVFCGTVFIFCASLSRNYLQAIFLWACCFCFGLITFPYESLMLSVLAGFVYRVHITPRFIRWSRKKADSSIMSLNVFCIRLCLTFEQKINDFLIGQC